MTAGIDLGELQEALARAVRGEAEPASTGRVDGQGAAAFEVGRALGNSRLLPDAQLAIYREQFLLRHLDALRADFRSLAHLLGPDGFDALGIEYLRAFPPSSFTLRDLGQDLARFAAERVPWSHDPLIAELARVEWAFLEAFDAPDAPALDPAVLASLPEDHWPGVRVGLQPAVRLLAMDHPAHDYRLAVRRDEPELARPVPRSCWAVVFRGAERLQCLDLEEDAFALLAALARGLPLGEACDEAASVDGEAFQIAAFGASVGAWFQRWTALGLFRPMG